VRIGIVCLPERGGYYATYALAKGLVSRGHDVVYFGPVDFRADVTRQGLCFITVWEQAFGPGTSDPLPVPESWWARLRLRVKFARQQPDDHDRWQLFEALSNRYLAGVLRRHQLDLILVDALFQEVIPELAATGVSIRVFATELSSGLRGVPPSTSGAMPHSRLFGKIPVLIAWWRCRGVHCWQSVQRHVTGLLVRLLTMGKEIAPPRDLMRRVRRAREEDMARAGLREVFWEYGWSPALPEIVLCCREFDFSEARASRVYLGHGIDLDRVEGDFPWDRIRGDQHLVYVSLGTHAARYPRKTLPLLKAVVEAAWAMPSLQFVIVLGRGRKTSALGELPTNVVVVPFAPQLALLAKAAVVVTNGGLGTIKECLWFGVPMIVVPCRWDQPGNAARVVFHRVGLRASIRRANASTLGQLIQECLRSQTIKEGVAIMRGHFRRSAEELDAGIDAMLQLPTQGKESS
jgi:UDP:flavonoid glycosyltransferase YjiC (YdhE family)